MFVSKIASRDNDVKNPVDVTSSSGAMPEMPLLGPNVAGIHVAHEEHSVSGPDITNIGEVDMSMTNNLLADSADYGDVVTSTPTRSRRYFREKYALNW